MFIHLIGDENTKVLSLVTTLTELSCSKYGWKWNKNYSKNNNNKNGGNKSYNYEGIGGSAIFGTN